ncbi:MAG: SDR family NAD(P)-dependent oxidoreductase [Clostridia bacterium]|nr:SDR family NAD(P)-dependent oxidoreductase [Clostridia bacterium]
MSIAIITGASSGIGREFAKQLNSKIGIDEFWFVARREDRMEALRDELGVKAKIIKADLCETEGIDSLRAELEAENPLFLIL